MTRGVNQAIYVALAEKEQKLAQIRNIALSEVLTKEEKLQLIREFFVETEYASIEVRLSSRLYELLMQLGEAQNKDFTSLLKDYVTTYIMEPTALAHNEFAAELNPITHTLTLETDTYLKLLEHLHTTQQQIDDLLGYICTYNIRRDLTQL